MHDLELERWNIDFDVSKSIRYHAYRRSFWDAADSWAKILTIISGATVLVSIIGSNNLVATIFAFIVAITSTMDVVLGFSRRARVHDGLYRAFSRLAQDIAEIGAPTATDINKWRRRRLEIEMDEPGVIDWLERRCSAEEAAARGSEIRSEWRLKPWQVILSQFVMWPSIPRGPAASG
jgi:hypothetical protein